ncbi:MAG: hypothetical protein LBO72_05850 [Helicobacteraceae bacterium]|jgi:hypothetical protein|nr:hypothetical protein [Helicobacteraceae bacterium]
MSKFAIRALIGALAVSAIAAEPEYVVEEVIYEPSATQQSAPQPLPRIDETEEYLIPNSPILQPTNIITVRAIGMGVAPESTISPAQALVLAKRAAILDGYRQIGEKMYGIKINAKDTLKDAVAQSSTVRTQMYAIIRNAEILETVFKDGLCQVEMEVKLDGRRWYRVLSGF